MCLKEADSSYRSFNEEHDLDHVGVACKLATLKDESRTNTSTDTSYNLFTE